MATIHDFFTNLRKPGIYRKPSNVSRNEVEYAVHGARGYLNQYAHLEQFNLVWLSAEWFKLVCKCCGR